MEREVRREYISKQQGFVSWQQLREGDIWADHIVFETMEDAKKVAECGEPNPFAEEFYSFINLNSCQTHMFSIERSYE